MTLSDWGDLAMLLGLMCAAPVAAAIDMYLVQRAQHRKGRHGR